jgi:hypothetical protein
MTDVFMNPEAWMLVVLREFEIATFPWTWSVAVAGDVPIPTNPAKLVVFKVAALIIVAYRVPNVLTALPIPTAEDAARIEPVNVADAPWTVRFCCSVVLPCVVTSPKLVMTGISTLLLELIYVRTQAKFGRGW